MTIARGFAVIVASAVAFSGAGAAIGWALGNGAPSYYRAMFLPPDAWRPGGTIPANFDPVQIGIGLGVSQGAVAGLVAGCVVVLAASLRRT